MDYDKIGELILNLRKENNFTQAQLANLLNISNKTVSKWERGLGCPDVSILPKLSEVFKVNLDNLIKGDLGQISPDIGNMKNLKFYYCDCCKNLITSTSDAKISCCGRNLEKAKLIKAENDDKLKIEKIENDFFISSNHEMSKNHYISFIALLTGDSIMIKKQYPEWNLQTRIPCFGHGTLVWHCTNHGFFYQYI